MGYFGIPFRNGVPIGLGSVVSFGAQQFDPSELFVGGTAGAWYDPSDLTTLFTTSAGTTPVAMPGGGAAVSVGRMLDKSGNGNHAIAFNDTTARPELRARVNLLTYSEEFDNGAWAKSGLLAFGSGSVANTTATTDPIGGNTADLIVQDSSAGVHGVTLNPSLAGGVYTGSVYVKTAGSTRVALLFDNAGGTYYAYFDVVAGTVTGQPGSGGGVASITAAGNGWWRLVISSQTLIAPRAVVYLCQGATNTLSFTGDGTSGIYIWGADLRPANIGANVPAYQRIADANTYDTSGFPLYLRFDGIDDSMYTPANLNLSGTDKVSVFAGVRKLSASTGFVAETSAAAESNNGAFRVGTDSGGIEYFISSRGTTSQQVNVDNAAYTSPVTNVVQSSFDIAAPLVSVRINGTAVGSNSGSQGTGNFGTYPLYVGSRNNASFRFDGHLHSLIIAGSAVSAGNISATEQWVAGKTGIVIP